MILQLEITSILFVLFCCWFVCTLMRNIYVLYVRVMKIEATMKKTREYALFTTKMMSKIETDIENTMDLKQQLSKDLDYIAKIKRELASELDGVIDIREKYIMLQKEHERLSKRCDLHSEEIVKLINTAEETEKQVEYLTRENDRLGIELIGKQYHLF